ncbi:Hypothetical protein D9617_4g001850 [Elsinoe fawcettii]|nr:Hypothetical protein D9617_4g001850 [Elsinoe fawcettii]
MAPARDPQTSPTKISAAQTPLQPTRRSARIHERSSSPTKQESDTPRKPRLILRCTPPSPTTPSATSPATSSATSSPQPTSPCEAKAQRTLASPRHVAPHPKSTGYSGIKLRLKLGPRPAGQEEAASLASPHAKGVGKSGIRIKLKLRPKTAGESTPQRTGTEGGQGSRVDEVTTPSMSEEEWQEVRREWVAMRRRDPNPFGTTRV